MTGTSKVIVITAKDKFTLTLKRKFTVIRGASGTGKTLLSILLNDYISHRKGVSVYSDIPVLVADDYNTLVGIESRKKSAIVVLDEDSVSDLVCVDGMQKFMELASGNELYFVLCTSLTLREIESNADIYNLKYEVKDGIVEHFLERCNDELRTNPSES